MPDIATRVAEAADKMTYLQNLRAQLEASANAHEAEARAERLRMTEIKGQIAEWATALNGLKVQQSVQSAEQAAKQAQVSAESHEKATAATLADAEKGRAEVEKLKIELTEMLAKAKEAAEPAQKV